MKHTPGPWRVIKEIEKRFDSKTGEPLQPRQATWIGSKAGKLIALVHDCSRESATPDAHLIAAAPEMLDTLKQAVSACPCLLKERDSGHRTDCCSPDWQAIIAKAEGRNDAST